MAKKTYHTITKEEYNQFFGNARTKISQNHLEKRGCFLSLWNRITQEKISADADNGLSPLKVALDIRKFEIELYWKRTTFFWAFLVAIYTAYFYICHNCGDNTLYLILLSFLATCFSFLWYLSNRGSKFWQENWEAHVSALENAEIGPLFKTIKINDNKFWNLLSAYDFSVSKANIIASILICLISIGLFIKDALSIYSSITNKDLIYLIQAHQSIAIFVIFMSLCIALIIIALIIIGFFSKGFASKLESEHPIDSQFIMGSDSYKNFKESK